VLCLKCCKFWDTLAVRAARNLLNSQLTLYCMGDFQTDGIQALHLDAMLAKFSDLRVPRVKDAQFHGKFSPLLQIL